MASNIVNDERINEIEGIENELLNSDPTKEYPNEQKEQHRIKFEKWLIDKYNNQSNEEAEKRNTTTYIINKAKYDWIRDVLNGVKKCETPTEKFKFNKKNYSLRAEDGRSGPVYQTAAIKRDGKTKYKKLKLAYSEQFFEVIFDAHCNKV